MFFLMFGSPRRGVERQQDHSDLRRASGQDISEDPNEKEVVHLTQGNPPRV